jgi:hypothetical protein
MVDTSLVTLVTVNLVPTAFLLLEEKPWQRDTLLPPLEGYAFIRVCMRVCLDDNFKNIKRIYTKICGTKIGIAQGPMK